MPPVRTRLLLSIPLILSIDAAALGAGSQKLPSTIRWSVAIASRPAAPPVIGADRVFIALQSGTVAAHSLPDGRELWRVELQADQPVALDGTRVFVGAGEAIHALNVADASIAWRAPFATLTAPLLAKDGWIVAASAAGVAAFRSADGTTVWTRVSGAQHQPATIEGDNLYLPLDDGRLLALDLRTGTERWVRRFAGPLTAVLAFADRVYVGAADNSLHCLSAGNGETSWRFRVGATLRGGPAAEGSRVFVTAMDNVVRAFDRYSGALLWHPSVPFRPTTGPVIVGTAVLVPGTSTDVRAFDAASGKPAGQIAIGAPLAMPPAFGESGGAILMAAVTGSLNGEWKLLLAGPAETLLPIEPLTALPGTIVPVDLEVPKR